MNACLPLAAMANYPHPKVSENYRFIPTHKIIDALQNEGFEVTSAQVGRTKDLSGSMYAKHMIRMRKAGVTYGDIAPEVGILNSHNRTSALRMFSGIIRFACMNGLIAGDIMGDTGKVYHNGKFTLDDVIASAIDIANSSHTRLSAIDAMKSRVIDAYTVMDFAHSAKNLLPNGHLLDEPLDLIAVRRSEDVENTVWNVFNRIQENIMKGDFAIHGLRKGLPIIRKARPVQNIDRNVKLNQDLWNLAVEYSK